MSLERVIDLYNDLLQESSKDLKNKLEPEKDKNRFVDVAKHAGYNFTVDELNDFLVLLKPDNLQIVGIQCQNPPCNDGNCRPEHGMILKVQLKANQPVSSNGEKIDPPSFEREEIALEWFFQPPSLTF